MAISLSPSKISLGILANTQGSIPFIDANGNFIEDNSNIFWDNVNKRLGIGTNSPISLLHIEESIAGTDANLTILHSDNTNASSDAHLQLVTLDTTGGDPSVIFAIANVADWSIGVDNSDGDKFKIAAFSVFGAADIFTIERDGNIGIGTTSPLRPLHIQDTGFAEIQFTSDSGGTPRDWHIGPATGDGRFRIVETDVDERVTILEGGNFGIGTINPGAKLEVAGQIKITGGTPGVDKVLTSDASGLATWETPAAGTGVGWTDDGTVVRLTTSTDRVGIGTTSPAAQLTLKEVTPEIRLVSSGDNNNTRITRTDILAKAVRQNIVKNRVDPFALQFDGADDYILGGDISASFTDEATFSVWIKLDNQLPTVGNGGIFTLNSISNQDDHYPFSDGKLYISAFATTRRINAFDNTGFDKTQWHHLAITTKPGSGNYKLYQNGVLVTSGIGDATIDFDTTFKIGAFPNFFLDGLMDDARIYSRSLSAAEISTLASGGDPSTTGLLVHWKFNEGSGTTAIDSSGNNNNGTFVSSPVYTTDVPLQNPSPEDVDVEAEVWTSEDGTELGEKGIHSFGDSEGRTVLRGKTIRFNLDASETEAARFTDDGLFGLGTTSPNSTHHVEGSVSKSIVTKTTDYTATSSDYTILVDATVANVTITLPTATGIKGRIYNIKKIDASIKTVLIDPNLAEKIDGSLIHTLTDQNESITVQSDGTNWFII